MARQAPFPQHGSLTLAQVRRWPPTVNVSDAARALGVSRSGLYVAIGEGTCPVETITVGRRVKVLTHSLIAVLEGGQAVAS
jgi:hypothetical protein